MSIDDATLVRRCLRNDPLAVRELVERYQDAVFAVCLRVLNHRQDAEDVVQEVFVRVFRSLARWDASRLLRPWILGIAVNRCRTHLAKRARRPDTVDYLQETAAAAPADDSAELTAEIERALAGLRVEYRTTFVLFHDEGQSYDTIAGVLGRPVGTIKTWLHRARLELLDALRSRGMVDLLPDTPDARG